MILENFAKPGDKNVLPLDYCKNIKVNGIDLTVEIEPGCWTGENRLGILVRGTEKGGQGRLNGSYISRKKFSEATFHDLNKLISEVKISKCKIAGCECSYIDDSDGGGHSQTVYVKLIAWPKSMKIQIKKKLSIKPKKNQKMQFINLKATCIRP